MDNEERERFRVPDATSEGDVVVVRRLARLDLPATASVRLALGRRRLGRLGRGLAALLRASRIRIRLAVEVVDLLAREREAEHRVAGVVLVVVVAQPPDHVAVAALTQVLGGVLRLLAPEGPLDGGRLVLAALAPAPLAVADGG